MKCTIRVYENARQNVIKSMNIIASAIIAANLNIGCRCSKEECYEIDFATIKAAKSAMRFAWKKLREEDPLKDEAELSFGGDTLYYDAAKAKIIY